MRGDKVLFNGTEVTIVSFEPYRLYGNLFVDVVDASGAPGIMMTPEARQAWDEGEGRD